VLSAILKSPGKIEIRDVAAPEPAEGEGLSSFEKQKDRCLTVDYSDLLFKRSRLFSSCPPKARG